MNWNSKFDPTPSYRRSNSAATVDSTNLRHRNFSTPRSPQSNIHSRTSSPGNRFVDASRFHRSNISSDEQTPAHRFSRDGSGAIDAHRSVGKKTIESSVGGVARAGARKPIKESGSLANDLLTYFEQQSTKDVRLVCQGKVFHTNKILLSARCPVFHAMLGPGSHFLEGRHNEVEIDDTEPSIVEAFLEVVHTDRYNNDRMIHARLINAIE